MADRFAAAYPYVDFFYIKGDRPTKWERISRDDLPGYIARASAHNCYYSVQQFASPVPVEADTPELHYAPPYADFDAADAADSQRDMLKLVQFCKEDLDLDDDEIRVWFSGQKGFHVVLSPVAFGVVPTTELTYIYKRLFLHLKEYLDLPTLDGSVYSKRRMWRIPNTTHGTSGLRKYELDHDQITDTIESIRELATGVGPKDSPSESFSEREVPAAVEYLARFAEEYAAEKAAATTPRVTLHPDAAPGDPICVTDIMTTGLKKPGDRNKATIVLGSYYKDVGRPLELAISDVTDWSLRLPPAHRRMDDGYIKANTSSVIKSVYEGDGYHFACNFIRSLHGDKSKGKDYERVACAGDMCPFIRGEKTVDEITDIHLSTLGEIDQMGKKVRVRLRVAGRTEAPYLVPAKIEVFATADVCGREGSCNLHAVGGKMTLDLTNELRTIVALCNVPDERQAQVIRTLIQQRSCKRFGYAVEQHMKVNEIAAVPKVKSVIADKGESVEGEYTYQRMYVLTDATFRVNSYYEVIGQVFAHPKTQQAIMVVTDAEPLHDDIADFELDAAIPLFAAYDKPTEALIEDLVTDIAVNVCKVAGRTDAIMAMLMTMHSPLHMQIEDETYSGWMQLLLVGDTGEAKSQVAERLMRHVGLGELLNAQNAGRTGLLYTIVNKDTTHNFLQWGALVLNDRGLLVIDEASGMKKEDYAEMRNARRDGKFTVTRSVSGEAATRTRLVMLSNPRFGKNMKEFSNPIETVSGLFESADIRRFDLVAGFRSGEVTRSMREKLSAYEMEPIFTSEVLRANLLWAWSRKQEDIYWTPGTAERIKSVADTLNAKYSGSNIHLLGQDAQEKVARMSQALAATLHASDAMHQMLYVRPEHVSLVGEMVDFLYSSNDLQFDIYTRQNSERADFDFDLIESELEEKFTYWSVDLDEIYGIFSRNKAVSNLMLESVCGESKTTKMVVKLMIRKELIKTSDKGGGFSSTARLNELISRWHRRTGK